MGGEVLGHLVEGSGQPAELVVRANGDAGGEVAARDLPHARHQRREAAGHAAGQRDAAHEHERNQARSPAEVARGHAAEVAQVVGDWPGDAERHAAAVLPRDDYPVVDRPHGGRALGDPGGGLQPRDHLAVRALGAVQVSLGVHREGDFTLVAPRVHQHGAKQPLEIQLGVDPPDFPAVLLDQRALPAPRTWSSSPEQRVRRRHLPRVRVRRASRPVARNHAWRVLLRCPLSSAARCRSVSAPGLTPLLRGARLPPASVSSSRGTIWFISAVCAALASTAMIGVRGAGTACRPGTGGSALLT
jgi:hypothetical protein